MSSSKQFDESAQNYWEFSKSAFSFPAGVTRGRDLLGLLGRGLKNELNLGDIILSNRMLSCDIKTESKVIYVYIFTYICIYI